MFKIGDVVGAVASETAMPAVASEPDRWLLLRVHPQTERRVHEKLTRRGICCYAPSYPCEVTVRRTYTWQKPIVQRRIKPLFPGLVFVPDLDVSMDRLKAISDDVAGLLIYAGIPLAARPKDMHDIRRIEQELNQPRSARRRRMAVGDMVRIRDDGPFAMWTGRIERLDDRGRLRVLIEFIKREVAVDLSSHQVEPVT